MRVHELAKELGLTSKDLLAKLSELKVAVTSHASALDAGVAGRLRRAFAKPAPSATARPRGTASRAAKSASAKASTQVAAPPQKPASVSPQRAAMPVAPPKPVPPAKPVLPPQPARVPPASVRPAIAPAPPPPRETAPHVSPKQAPAPLPPAKPAVKPAVAPVAAAAPSAPAAPAAPPIQLELKFPVTVKDLAAKMGVKPADLIKHLIQQGVFASILQPLDAATATRVATAFNCVVLPQPTLEQQLLKLAAPSRDRAVPRAPVVTLMGHVDHGKTSLLDAVRRAKVAEGEAGGITQHIGAYEVQLPKGRVTFLDTPGHEAFSALRARGANVTDIVVLVVAADDGVMPQTIEAIDHARAADVPIVVAMNKIDRPEANPQKIKQQLAQHELLSEDWGGKTIVVLVSAKTRQGIDELLEMLLLEAELLELRADPTTPAQGVVIEAKQTKTHGPVATLLIQQGTLRIGDTVVIGPLIGRVRAMMDDRGHRLKEAGPAKPIEVSGLPEVPKAGDQFLVVEDEKLARQLAEQRKDQRARQAVVHPKRITLEELHQRITEGQLKELRLVLKADVQGSLEAIVQSLQKLDAEKHEVQFRILHMGVGDITESDVMLSAASDAIIVGFHVGIEPQVQVLAATEGVDMHIYQIIYELVDAIKAAIEGLLGPMIEETFIGRTEIRKLFQVSKVGTVAGCAVIKGAIRRDCTMRVIRGRERLYEGKIANLKRGKDDVREVLEGTECGISVQGFTDYQVGDLLEAWELKKVARRLS